MSAFVVGKDHIDLLVSAGLDLPGAYGPLQWAVRDLTDEETRETHQRGEPWGPGAQAVWGSLYRKLTDDNAGWVGAMLWAENARSVNHRYDEEEWEDPYVHAHVSPTTYGPVDVLKAVSCYEYQSCEHPEWQTSEARRYCEAVRDAAIGRLDGYRDAAWEWHRPTVSA